MGVLHFLRWTSFCLINIEVPCRAIEQLNQSASDALGKELGSTHITGM